MGDEIPRGPAMRSQDHARGDEEGNAGLQPEVLGQRKPPLVRFRIPRRFDDKMIIVDVRLICEGRHVRNMAAGMHESGEWPEI